MQSHSWIVVLKYYFIWDLTHFVLCNQYTFYIAHMEIELKSNSFKHWNLGSYVCVWEEPGNEATDLSSTSLVPRPPRPAFVACSTKSGGRPGRTYHVMRATTDVMFSLLTSGFVLSPSLFFPWIQFVLSVQFVQRLRLLLDRSWLTTVRDVSRGTHHVMSPSRPSPAFRTASDKSWAWRPGNEAIFHHM